MHRPTARWHPRAELQWFDDADKGRPLAALCVSSRQMRHRCGGATVERRHAPLKFYRRRRRLRASAIKPVSPCEAKRAACEPLFRSPVSTLAQRKGQGAERGCGEGKQDCGCLSRPSFALPSSALRAPSPKKGLPSRKGRREQPRPPDDRLPAVRLPSVARHYRGILSGLRDAAPDAGGSHAALGHSR